MEDTTDGGGVVLLTIRGCWLPMSPREWRSWWTLPWWHPAEKSKRGKSVAMATRGLGDANPLAAVGRIIRRSDSRRCLEWYAITSALQIGDFGTKYTIDRWFPHWCQSEEWFYAITVKNLVRFPWRIENFGLQLRATQRRDVVRDVVTFRPAQQSWGCTTLCQLISSVQVGSIFVLLLDGTIYHWIVLNNSVLMIDVALWQRSLWFCTSRVTLWRHFRFGANPRSADFDSCQTVLDSIFWYYMISVAWKYC